MTTNVTCADICVIIDWKNPPPYVGLKSDGSKVQNAKILSIRQKSMPVHTANGIEHLLGRQYAIVEIDGMCCDDVDIYYTRPLLDE